MNTDLVVYKRMPWLHYDILVHLFAMLNLKDLLRAEKGKTNSKFIFQI